MVSGSTPQHIIDEALKLPESDRARIIQDLMESLSPGSERLLDDAWAAELDRRYAEIQRGDVDTVTWSELRKQK